MAKRATQRADLKAVPLLLNESLYVGIDIGKGRHLAGFLSKNVASGNSSLLDSVGSIASGGGVLAAVKGLAQKITG